MCQYWEGHLKTSVVHTRDQRSAKKGLFFESEHDSGELQLGVKMCLFQEKESFCNSIRGRIWVIFQILYYTEFVPKKSCLRGQIECKTAQKFFFMGIFAQKNKSLLGLCFENLCIQHYYLSGQLGFHYRQSENLC